MTLITSAKQASDAVLRHTIPAGEPYLFEVKKGQTVRLHDLEGNQAVDTLFYSAANPRERYDAQRTLRRQNNAYLTSGSVLYSNLGNPLLTIVADTCGRHDTRWPALPPLFFIPSISARSSLLPHLSMPVSARSAPPHHRPSPGPVLWLD